MSVGLQPFVVQERERARQHTRLLTEPNRRVELPVDGACSDSHRPLDARAVPRRLARRYIDRHWSRRRDATVLEHLPAQAQPRWR